MIHLGDIVRVKRDPPDSSRHGWTGIVVDLRCSAVSQTATVLWPEDGTEEKWISDGLEVLNETSTTR